MFGIGSILGTVTRVVAVPFKVVESVADVATGGDGSRRSARNGFLSEALESLDDQP